MHCRLQKKLQQLDLNRNKSLQPSGSSSNVLPSAFDAPLAYKSSNKLAPNQAAVLDSSNDSHYSAAERVKLAKERKRQEEEEQYKQRLSVARKESYNDRRIAESKNHQFIFGSAVNAPHANNTRLAGGAEETELFDADSSELEEVSEDVTASGRVIAELQSALMEQTRRIQDMRTSLQVTAMIEQNNQNYEDEEIDELDSYDDEELIPSNEAHVNNDSYYDHTESEQSQQLPTNSAADAAINIKSVAASELNGNLELRKKALAKECVKFMGRDEFIAAYEYLKSAAEHDHTEQHKIKNLLQILGADKIKHWKKIDELIFMETC
jgi:hypothetical protein